MLDYNVKKYIKDSIKQQYQVMNRNDIEVNNRIKCFEKLIYIGLEQEKYKNEIEEMVNELNRVAQYEGRVSFKKIGNVNVIINLLIDIMNVKTKQDPMRILKILQIINNDQDYQVIVDTNKTLEEKEEYLKNSNKSALIPYAKAIYIGENYENIGEEISINEYWNLISNLYISYIELAYKARKVIMAIYVDKKIHLEEYLKNIIENYESKINFKYIPSSVIQLEQNYSIEETNDNYEMEEAIPFIDINEDERLLKIKLIGYAGVGKSTTLEFIEYTDALKYEENHKIPIIINLITVEEKEDIKILIAKKLGLQPIDVDVIEYLIEENKINLYLDGINEISIPDYYERTKFLNELEEFLIKEENKKLKVIVTDRDNDGLSILNNYDTYLIQGMTQSDIDAFIEGNSRQDMVEKIKEVLKDNEEFEETITHPIMLKNLISIIECGKPIPLSKEELSEVYLQAIIEREINDKNDSTAKYINGALTYMVKKAVENTDWTSNMPNSYFKVIEIFYEYANNNNLDIDAEDLLTLIRKMGILKEVEYEKYAFTDERFFNIYYKYAVLDEDEGEE